MIDHPPSSDIGPPRPAGEPSASAKALLLTLLGEFVLPGGGSVWTSTLVKAMSALGVEPKTTRQALARTAKTAHLLEPERFGRRTRWSLTPHGKTLLEEGADRIYNFGIRDEPWDNTWLVVIASVPEADRHLRYRLRTRLAWVGFAPIGPGIWLSPWSSHEAEALQTLDEIGLASSAASFIGRLGDFGNNEERIHEAWDLGLLESRYREFMRQTTAATATNDLEAFVATTLLVHAWRQFPTADPGLPTILLPPTWNGGQAAQLFREYHQKWSPGARRFWELIARSAS